MKKVQPLNERQMAAIAMLVAGNRPTDVEKKLKIAHNTLWDWRTNNQAFQDETRRQQAVVLTGIQDRLIGLGEPAIRCLEDVINHGETESSRVRAATFILEKIMVVRVELTQSKDAAAGLPAGVLVMATPAMLAQEAVRRWSVTKPPDVTQ